ncbi:MAG TPA: metallophosphoesterase family protein [Deinococcales bacterium]|nr:metallophosphoesterase family protein [Deinococcales bacterium]
MSAASGLERRPSGRGPGTRVGLVADTHGLVRPGLLALLAGCDLILHAGDIGRGVLEALSALAPVRAVQGNNDPPQAGPLYLDLTLDGVPITLTHGHTLPPKGRPRALAERHPLARVIVYGHTHRAAEDEVPRPGGPPCLVINPGAAGPKRFGSPVKATAGLLETSGGGFTYTRNEIEP